PRPTPRQSRRSLLAALHWDRRSEPRGRDKCGPSYHLHRRLFLLRIKHAKAGLSRATVAKREPAGAAHLERVLAGLAVRGRDHKPVLIIGDRHELIHVLDVLPGHPDALGDLVDNHAVDG